MTKYPSPILMISPVLLPDGTMSYQGHLVKVANVNMEINDDTITVTSQCQVEKI